MQHIDHREELVGELADELRALPGWPECSGLSNRKADWATRRMKLGLEMLVLAWQSFDDLVITLGLDESERIGLAYVLEEFGVRCRFEQQAVGEWPPPDVGLLVRLGTKAPKKMECLRCGVEMLVSRLLNHQPTCRGRWS